MRRRQRPQQAEKKNITTRVDAFSQLPRGSVGFFEPGPARDLGPGGFYTSRDSPASGAEAICTSPADAPSVPRVDRSSKGENTLAPKQTTRSIRFSCLVFFGPSALIHVFSFSSSFSSFSPFSQVVQCSEPQ